jgi:hypothetical protein
MEILNIFSFIIGGFLIYLSAFTYNDEHNYLHSKFERFWMGMDDVEKKITSTGLGVFQGLALHKLRRDYQMIGENLKSLDSILIMILISAGFSGSTSSLLIAFTWVIQNPGSIPFGIGFIFPVSFFIFNLILISTAPRSYYYLLFPFGRIPACLLAFGMLLSGISIISKCLIPTLYYRPMSLIIMALTVLFFLLFTNHEFTKFNRRLLSLIIYSESIFTAGLISLFGSIFGAILILALPLIITNNILMDSGYKLPIDGDLYAGGVLLIMIMIAMSLHHLLSITLLTIAAVVLIIEAIIICLLNRLVYNIIEKLNSKNRKWIFCTGITMVTASLTSTIIA